MIHVSIFKADEWFSDISVADNKWPDSTEPFIMDKMVRNPIFKVR